MDKELICVDTSVLIDYYRKKNKSKTKLVELSKKYDFAISVITQFEILTGSNLNQARFWETLFSNIKLLPMHGRDAEIASEIVKTLTKRNKIIGLKDIFIASSAIANDLQLSTLNLKDFKRVDNLKLLEE